MSSNSTSTAFGAVPGREERSKYTRHIQRNTEPTAREIQLEKQLHDAHVRIAALEDTITLLEASLHMRQGCMPTTSHTDAHSVTSASSVPSALLTADSSGDSDAVSVQSAPSTALPPSPPLSDGGAPTNHHQDDEFSVPTMSSVLSTPRASTMTSPLAHPGSMGLYTSSGMVTPVYGGGLATQATTMAPEAGMMNGASRAAAARRRAGNHSPPKGGGKKGKLEAWERALTDQFIAAVRQGHVRVARGDLARALRAHVNTERHQEFYEKLVSRRKLNVVLAPHLAPRRGKRTRHQRQGSESCRTTLRAQGAPRATLEDMQHKQVAAAAAAAAAAFAMRPYKLPRHQAYSMVMPGAFVNSMACWGAPMGGQV